MENETMDIALREQMDVYIDAKEERNHKFIRYSWKNRTLAVSMNAQE